MIEPGERIGDWVVEKAIGEGGMGSVFRARNALVSDIVAALKILKPHELDHAAERFFREVRTMYALRHEAVVRVTGWGEDERRGLLWLAMELVEGEDLGRRLARGAMPPEVAVPLFAALADGLAHAHGKGIFHRDLKPANVLVRDDHTPVIVDFGIAVEEGRTRLTRTGMIAGTPAYMPPEVFAADAPPDPARCDVYALGQMLHEALVGTPAFAEIPGLSPSQQIVKLIARKTMCEALDPGPIAPEGLREVVRRATAPEPTDRLGSAREMHAALLAVRGGAEPETRWVPVTPLAAAPPSAAPPSAAPPSAAPPSATPPSAAPPSAAPPLSVAPAAPPAEARSRAVPVVLGGVVIALLAAGAAIAGAAAIGVALWPDPTPIVDPSGDASTVDPIGERPLAEVEPVIEAPTEPEPVVEPVPAVEPAPVEPAPVVAPTAVAPAPAVARGPAVAVAPTPRPEPIPAPQSAPVPAPVVAPAPAPAVRSEPLSAAEISAVFKRDRFKMAKVCWESGIAGQIDLGVTIREGAVTEARVLSSTLGAPAVEECFVREAKRLRFPVTTEPATASFPLVFGS